MGMRAGTRNVEVFRDNGVFFGLSLGADFTAEHEWGTKGINAAFDTRTEEQGKPFGLPKRQIRAVPEAMLRFVEGDKHTLLDFGDYNEYNRTDISSENLSSLVNSEGRTFPLQELRLKMIYSDPDATGKMKSLRKPRVDPAWEFSGAWCGESFAILASKEKLGKEMKELWEAIQSKDALIFQGGSDSPWGAGGLYLLIASKVPAEWVKMAAEQDQAMYELHLLDEQTRANTKLDEKLLSKQSGMLSKGYHLSPRKTGEIKSVASDNRDVTKTAYPVIYFLNPWAWKDAESGWYTVEDLLAYCNNEGPVMKKAVEV